MSHGYWLPKWTNASSLPTCQSPVIVVRRGKRHIIRMDGVANEQYFDKYGEPKMEDDEDDEVPCTTRRSRTTVPKGRPFKKNSICEKEGKKIVKR